MLNLNNANPRKLSRALPEAVHNPLAEKSWLATLFGLIQVFSFLAWFYWAYSGYIRWYEYSHGRVALKTGEQTPQLPETGIVKVGIPLFLVSILVEFIISNLVGQHENYRAAETVSNFSNGLMQQLVEMWTTMLGEWLGLALITAVPYRWIYDNFALTRSLEGNWQGFVFMWFARDFGYYWFHRAAHRSAFMWAVHGVHHIPNEFNYSVNLSQGAIQRITSAAFYAPLALFCPPELYIIIFPMEKIYGFFTHTRLVSKMHYISLFFVTPSTHRVHHAGAPSKYIDKNYGEMLTIWDRMFGTHEEEVEPVVFGHVHPFDSWNPLEAQLVVWKGIWAKTKTTRNWIDKALCFVLPPGWDPVSGGEYPLVDSTPYSAFKYDSSLPWTMTFYLLGWFIITLGLGILQVRTYHSFSLVANALLFANVFGGLCSLGALSDRNPRSGLFELLRLFHVPFVTYSVGTILDQDRVLVMNVTIVVSVLAVISSFILLAHGNIFVHESSEERAKRVWIREAGRAFTETLELYSDKAKQVEARDKVFVSPTKPRPSTAQAANGKMNGARSPKGRK